MTKSFVLNFKFVALCVLLLGGSISTAAPVKVSTVIEQADLWETNVTQFKKKYPNVTWEKTGDQNVYISNGEGMIYLGKPLEQVKLQVSKEFELIQSLKMVVLSEQQSEAMTKTAYNTEAKKWRDLVSKSLKKKSKVMPSIQLGDNKHTRLAWRHGKSTIILGVITSDDAKSIELTYHEKEHGMARLKLKGAQGVEEASGAGPVKPDSDDKPKVVDSGQVNVGEMSHATTPSIQKQYNITDNFTAEWPKLVKAEVPEITVVKEDKEKKEFIYHSSNYEFICDVPLSKNVVKKFASLFEATRLYCKQIPLSMARAHLPEGSQKYKILLFGTMESYFKNGGPQGSAGVYMSGKGGVIMVPLESLGVKKVGSGYMFDYKKTNKTLPHEITHQLTNVEYYSKGARGWFSEGLAECIATTGYRSGKFMSGSTLSDVRTYVTGFSKKDDRGRNLGDEITVPDLKEFMLMSYGQFTSNANFNYGVGALYTYYFLHMDGDGDRKNINAFLAALNAGKEGEEALKVLLAGRTFDELEKDISKAWRSRGVKLSFK